MRYNLLGNTGLKVSELCLGTMTFGGKGLYSAIGTLPQDEVDALVRRSVEAGINFIDTANVYSEGLSEQMTGTALRNLGLRRDDLIIATKVRGRVGEGPNHLGLTRKHILQQVEESLRRLQIDYIDLYQIHGYDTLTPLEETLAALDTLVTSGKVRYIGCSNLSAWHIMKSLSVSERHDYAKFISLQAYYTIAARDIEREIVPLLLDQKIGLMVWSPLAGGLLSGKYTRNSAPEEGRRVNFDFPPVDREKVYNVVDAMQEIAKPRNVSVARIALAWLLHQPVVSTIVIGAKRPQQLEDNLAAIDLKLDPSELEKLDTASKLAPEYPGWMLEYQGKDRKWERS
ncbi:aldo/keto reductase [Flavitalea sp. BT771]|uniref:aldo/keto reductase n=1 Tax=Flavitalea sp. BT771 TaxID=3063329 RepID=UPI0026E33F2A|nr:aldo/keto reductase [Flavitalea sp. BT771]MDO6434829.1 aldo/keto reductase [Flavitalea sp. BT771]MDV6223729.1 aldo/keto reductase [Flavitalea sp. BT771]